MTLRLVARYEYNYDSFRYTANVNGVKNVIYVDILGALRADSVLAAIVFYACKIIVKYYMKYYCGNKKKENIR